MTTLMQSTIVGHVTTDPAADGVQPASANLHRCEFAVVVSRKWWDPETRETENRPAFLTIRCKGFLATNVLSTVRKGDLVIATGHLDQVGHGRRSQLVLVANEVGLGLSVDPQSIDDEDDQ